MTCKQIVSFRNTVDLLLDTTISIEIFLKLNFTDIPGTHKNVRKITKIFQSLSYQAEFYSFPIHVVVLN